MRRTFYNTPSPAALRGARPHAIFTARNRPIKFTLIKRSQTTKLTHERMLTNSGNRLQRMEPISYFVDQIGMMADKKDGAVSLPGATNQQIHHFLLGDQIQP